MVISAVDILHKNINISVKKQMMRRLIMKIPLSRGLGKILVPISVVFIIAALYTLFFYVNETNYVDSSLPDRPRSYFQQFYERAQQYAHLAGPAIPSPHIYTWPYRWLSQPLAIVGIFLFLTGLFIGYRDDITQLF